MSGGFARIVAHLADKYLTEKIANSTTVQRAVVKTVDGVKNMKNVAADRAASAPKAGKPQGPVAGFFAAMREEAVKDLNKITGKK